MTDTRDTSKAPPGLTADKAFNQLVAVLSGRETALATEHLKTSPHQRIQECHEMALEELEVLKEREEMDGRKTDTRQLKRKLPSIQSLLRLAEVIYQGVDGTPVGEE